MGLLHDPLLWGAGRQNFGRAGPETCVTNTEVSDLPGSAFPAWEEEEEEVSGTARKSHVVGAAVPRAGGSLGEMLKQVELGRCTI